MQLVEKYFISSNNEFYPLLDNLSFKAKNLYNYVNYHIRQSYTAAKKLRTGEILSSGEKYQLKLVNDKILKHGKIFNYIDGDHLFLNYYICDSIFKEYDYRELPSACAQQCLRLLEKNWKSYFAAIAAYCANPSKFKAKPRIPGYKDTKKGRSLVILPSGSFKFKNGILSFPKAFNGFTLKVRDKIEKINQVRFISTPVGVNIEVVHTVKNVFRQPDNGEYMGIDIGVDNLATVVFNDGTSPVIIDGKGLKSMNQYYNKYLASFKSALPVGMYSSARICRFIAKRQNKVNDYLHKASKIIVNLAVKHDVSVIVVGLNPEWKQKSSMGVKNNQTFQSIPFKKFINMVIYKAALLGITAIVTEESYTSGTSFLDNEEPIFGNYNKARRIHRGLFRSNDGTLINADVNAAYQILRKAEYSVVKFSYEKVNRIHVN